MGGGNKLREVFFLNAVDQGEGLEDGAKCQVTLKGASGPAASVGVDVFRPRGETGWGE